MSGFTTGYILGANQPNISSWEELVVFTIIAGGFCLITHWWCKRKLDEKK